MNRGLYGIPKNRTYEPPLSASYAFTASHAESASIAITASYALSGGGVIAAAGATLYSTTPFSTTPNPGTANNSIFLGDNAGYQANSAQDSNFLGYNAGYQASQASFSNFLGNRAGKLAINAYSSNFLGSGAGENAENAGFSNFFGVGAGASAISASYSILLGYYAGYAPSINSIGTNNIIIGTNITLASQRRDSINIGGIIFGTGSHFSTNSQPPFSGSANGRIGINVVNPTYSFEVSGTVGFPNLTNSSTATKVVLVDNSGQLFTTASSALGGGSVTPGDGNQAIQFNSASVFSGSAKLKYDYVNSNIILTGSLLLSQSYISKVDYVDFNTTSTVTPSVGRVYWNDVDGTLSLGLKGGNVISEVGQGLVTRVVNKTSPLVDLLSGSYQVVVISGAQGQRLAVKLAQADNDANSAGTLGIVAEDIARNQEGFVITVGLLKNRNTTGNLQGETWNDGDVLYLSPTTAGAITNIKPQAPQHTVIIGYVEYAHQNNGKIYVKIDNGYELDELHNVRITTSSLSTGDLLMYDSGSRLWTNSKTLSGSYTLSGSLTTNDGVSVQSLTASIVSASAITGSLFGTASWANNVASTGIVGDISRIATGSVTASVTPSQFSVVSGSMTEFTVTGTGVTIGNAITDTHLVTGSLGVTGSLNITGPTTLLPVTNSFAISASGYYITGSNNTPMIDLSGIWATSGTPTAFRLNVIDNGSGGNSRMIDTQIGGNSVFSVSRDGRINVGRNSVVIFPTNAGSDFTATGTNLTFQSNEGSTANYMFNFRNINTVGYTTGNAGVINTPTTFGPSSGTSTFNVLNVSTTISQSATAAGITRGLFINPTLTSAADFRAIEVNSGSLVMADSYLASGSRSGSLVNLTHITNTAGNVTSFLLNASGNAGASSNLLDLQIAGSSAFRVDRSGVVRNTAGIVTSGEYLTNGTRSSTSGGQYGYLAGNNLSHTSGIGTYAAFAYIATINQSAAASGSITRGLFINPTLTSAADFRAIEVNSGSLIMNDSYLASGSRSGSLVSLTHITNTAGNVTSFILNASGSAGASSNIMDLQVAGTSSFTVSRTGAVTINTFASNAAFSYTNSGLTFLSYTPNNNTLAVGSTSARGTITAAVLTLSNSNTSTTAGAISIDNPKSTSTGSVDYITNTSTIAPTAGTSSFNGYTFAAVINQTSTATGITRGLFINPTLTSAADFRAIETTRGRIIFSSAQFTGSVSQSSYFTITGSMNQPATTGSQIYAATVAPLITYTAPSQTNTAFRVLPTFTGSAALTASQQNIIADFGASAVGSQFVVNDVTSGSIYQVNDVSGLPIIEATSNWDVNIYDFPTTVFRKTGTNIIMSSSLTVVTGSGIEFQVTNTGVKIGNASTDTHQVTGSITIATGSLTLTSGSVTMPNRPAFRVYGNGTINNLSTTTNGDGTLNSNNFATDYQQGTGFNASTGIFTAPVAGLYSVHMICRNDGNANFSQLAVLKNNSNTAPNVIAMVEFAGNSTMNHAGASSIARLAVGDTLRLKVLANTITFDGNDSWAVAYIG